MSTDVGRPTGIGGLRWVQSTVLRLNYAGAGVACRRSRRMCSRQSAAWNGEECEGMSSVSAAKAMKLLSGALRAGDGEVGRILRSQSLKSVHDAKVVDSKISFKSKKVVKSLTADKSNVGSKDDVAHGRRSAKREAGSATAVASASEAVLENGKRQKSNTVVVVSRNPVNTSLEEILPGGDGTGGVGSVGLGAEVVAEVAEGTVSVVKTSWSISLSSAEAIAEATKYLTAADGKLASIIGAHGQGPKFEQSGSCFTALVRSIVYQQLAGKAASAIHGRLVVLCGGPDGVTPAIVAALTAAELREIGISGRKAIYLHDLAQNFLSGALSDEKLVMMNEDELVTALTAVKGIGVWSAHMFMIFYLHKSDVLPVGDLAIRKGFQRLYHLKALPSAAEMEALATSWRPYRSLASWYLWRVSETTLPSS